MIKPGTAIERPGEGGYFGRLAPAAPVGEGGASSAGTSCSPSSPSTATSSEPGQAKLRKPARTTANR